MDHYHITKIRGRRYKKPSTPLDKQPHALLMTSTINPPSSAVTRSNTSTRLSDYLTALEFNLSIDSKYVDRILFIDNSASNVTEIEDLATEFDHDKLVEIISFSGNDHPTRYGKAYGEFKLIDFGLTHTTLISSCDTFWKTTGRLRLVNIEHIISLTRGTYDLLCDLHNFPFVGTGHFRRNHWMDLRVFSCTVRAYDAIFRSAYKKQRSKFGAPYLYERVLSLSEEFDTTPRFPCEPHIRGISGRHNREYNAGIQKVKSDFRNIIRHIAPGVWI